MIRPYRDADTEALYDICLRTGANGEDASSMYADPRLLGEVFVGPYLRFEPELAFVVDEGETGKPTGYILGARDTDTFETTCEEFWWPTLRTRYPLGSFPAGSADERLVGIIHQKRYADPEIIAEYPSHLHIDLLPSAQGHGLGRALTEQLLAALREAGSPGVHLGVGTKNERAFGFYQRLGFRVLRRTPEGLTMGRPTS